MKQINFKEFKSYTSIEKKETRKQDISLAFADLIYKSAVGVMAHDIALRIYEADGPVSFNDEEIKFLSDFVKNMTPVFQDSFKDNIYD